ncbi:MAG: hypothetical protein PHT37_03530 [Candidatus Cloacimonetes bacterium]|nr:hypothetical protein [Candidatus Cloacimonadota bacterium]MDD2423375.1 hypothetical protein [Candidatus Cloacimonadota bacterium]MDD4276945.1 hypothetical protein [Candidatus Cloacimonadota bacterium]MDY0325166.1 hypothetical protein [Candidatus Cloacimonadaceae bacterium]
MNSTADLSKVKIEDDHIEVEIDRVSVTGKILERNSGEITISITSPYRGISQSSGNVPIPLRQFRNYSGPAGATKAAELLANLYSFCLYVEEHKAELLATLAEYEKAVHYAKHLDPVLLNKRQRMDAITQELKEYKRALKSGEIDSATYQRKLGPLKKEMEDLALEAEMESRMLLLQSFQAYEDSPVGKLWPENVIQYLSALRDPESG